MANKNVDRLYAQAQRALRKKDQSTAAQLCRQILQEDLNHSGAWTLLYRLYGKDQPFPEFQRQFAGRYYPERAHLLQRGEVPSASAPDRPPSRLKQWFQRLTGRKPTPAPVPAAPPPPPPAQPTTPPPVAAPKPSEPAPIATRPEPATVAPTPVRSSGIEINTPPPTGKIRVLVVDDIAETRQTIIRALQFEPNFEVVGEARDGHEGVRLAKQTRPDVVVMDVNMPEMDGISATALIRRAVPFTQVVILTVQDDADYIRRAMLAGARDFLAKPPMIEELSAAVERAGGIAHQEKLLLPAAAEAQAVIRPRQGGRVITIYSPRGGSGCTTLAVNLAAIFHDEQHPTVVVDGNLQFGDVPVLLNVRPPNTIRDLAPRASELDQELVEEVLGKHPSGLRLLAPPRPEQAEIATAEQFGQIVNFLSGIFSYVVIDTAHELGEITLAAFDVSQLVVVVTTQDIPSIARVQRFLELAPSLGLKPERLLVLMNQYNERVNIRPDKVAASLQHPIALTLPLEFETTLQSINRGEPFMLNKNQRSTPLAKSVLQAAEAIQQKLAELEKPPEELI